LKHPFIKALTAPDNEGDLQVKKITAANELFRYGGLPALESKLILSNPSFRDWEILLMLGFS